MNIEHQIAVVTGGYSGMGRACVEALRAQGALVISWDRQGSDEPYSVNCDVTSDESVAQAMQKTLDIAGSAPRVLINCAGIAPAQRMLSKQGMMPLDVFQQVIQVNLVGTFNVMRHVTYHMAQLTVLPESLERGVIINTASIAAFEGQIGQSAYSASKGGIVSMTLPLAREFAQHGIRVNAIAPGLIATPLLLNMPESVQTHLKETIPFPNRFGKPTEFASLVQHVIENPLLNGEVIRLDGALRMGAR